MSAATIRPAEAAEPWLTASAPARRAMPAACGAGNANTGALARQRLLAQVRRLTEQLKRRAERAGIFARVTPDGLARAELQRCLEEAGQHAGQGAACRCLVLLACAVDGGTSISIEVFEKCRELAERSSDPALRALFFTCARRIVLGEPVKVQIPGNPSLVPTDDARRAEGGKNKLRGCRQSGQST